MVTDAKDDKWNYLISGYREEENELIFAKAGNEATGEYLAELFRKDGLKRVQCLNLSDV